LLTRIIDFDGMLAGWRRGGPRSRGRT